MLVAIFLLIPPAAFVILALVALLRVRDPDYVRIGFGKWRFIQVGRETPGVLPLEADQSPTSRARPDPGRTLSAAGPRALPPASPSARPPARPPPRRPASSGSGRSGGRRQLVTGGLCQGTGGLI